MSKKVPRINPIPFVEKAIAQPDPVQTVQSPPAPMPSTERQPKRGREGRVQIMGWFQPSMRTDLKQIALESERTGRDRKTLEDVMLEAFNLYLWTVKMRPELEEIAEKDGKELKEVVVEALERYLAGKRAKK